MITVDQSEGMILSSAAGTMFRASTVIRRSRLADRTDRAEAPPGTGVSCRVSL